LSTEDRVAAYLAADSGESFVVAGGVDTQREERSGEKRPTSVKMKARKRKRI
jgi:hypothetical protein